MEKKKERQLFKDILKNYSKIQKEMNKNKLMTKKIFQRKLTNILNV